MPSIRHLVALSTGLLAAMASASSAGQPVSGTHSLDPDGLVRVETIAGSIVVKGDSPSGVSVSGMIGEDLKFEISGSDRNVLVKVEWPERRWGRRSAEEDDCRLEVHVPSGASLEVETVSASIDASGVDGTVDLETVSGSIDVAGNPRSVEVEAVSGDLTLDVDSKRVSLEAVSGTVKARTGGGEFELELVSGDVELTGDGFEGVSIESVSGHIEFTGGLAPKAELEINNHSGDVEVGFRGDASAEVDVSTFSGGIESELGGESRRTSKFAPGEEYHRTIGDGSARVTIDAFSGTVRLRRI